MGNLSLFILPLYLTSFFYLSMLGTARNKKLIFLCLRFFVDCFDHIKRYILNEFAVSILLALAHRTLACYLVMLPVHLHWIGLKHSVPIIAVALGYVITRDQGSMIACRLAHSSSGLYKLTPVMC